MTRDSTSGTQNCLALGEVSIWFDENTSVIELTKMPGRT